MMEFIAGELEKHGEVGLEECFLDGSFVRAKGGGDQIGKTKSGKGQKLMLMVDANGLPIAARTAPANPGEVTLVQMLLEFIVTSEAPERIVADKAYDSDRLDEQLATDGIRLIAPNRSQSPQDSRRTPSTPIQATLESRTGLCMAAQLSSAVYPLGTICLPLPSLCSPCMCHHPFKSIFGIASRACL